MTVSTNQQGNVGMLAIACVTVIVVLVVFFALNYVQLMDAERRTQSAVEAACLQAARDVSRVVVDGELGRISLADDLSVKRPYIPSRKAYSQTAVVQTSMADETRQIKSVNTLLGEIRLRALIASQPEIANTTMLYRAKIDILRANKLMNVLKSRLVSALEENAPCFDKTGQVINIHRDMEKSYRGNQIRLGRIYSRLENVHVTLGAVRNLQNSVLTTMPTPKPSDADPSTRDEGGFYRAYKSYDVPGLSNESVQFVPESNSAGLIDNSQFVPYGDTSFFPSAVQMEGDEIVTMIEPGGSGKPVTNKIHFKVTAKCPVGPSDSVRARLAASPSGSFLLSFPQGFPNTNSPNRINFYSLASIMNASMLDTESMDAKSPYRFWNHLSSGTWRVAVNGAVPGGGVLLPRPYLNLPSRQTDDPSVALSFLVYDWLASMGLKPNVESVVKALTFDLRDYANYRHIPAVEFSIISSLGIRPAYAQETHLAVTSAILNVDEKGHDARNLSNWSKFPELYERQQARMWNYLSPDTAMPSDSLLVKVSDNGKVTTTDGNPVTQATSLQSDIVSMNHVAWQTYVNAIQIINSKLVINSKLADLSQSSRTPSDLIKSILNKNPRLANAVENSRYAMAVSAAMKENLKALSANGVRQVNDLHYALSNADFYPPKKAASTADLLSDRPCDTGQDKLIDHRDWCGEKSELVFLRGSKVVEVSSNNNKRHFSMLPVMASNQEIYANWNKYLFHLDLKESAEAYSGQILMHRLRVSPYGRVSLPKGQVHYQNVSALVEDNDEDPSYRVFWQVQARDLNANHFVDADYDPEMQHAQSASYYADIDLNSYDGQACQTSPMRGVCPPLVSEFAIVCPVVQAPGPTSLPLVTLWGASNGQSAKLMNVESGWQPSLYSPDDSIAGKKRGRLSSQTVIEEWRKNIGKGDNWMVTSGTVSITSGEYPDPPALAI